MSVDQNERAISLVKVNDFADPKTNPDQEHYIPSEGI